MKWLKGTSTADFTCDSPLDHNDRHQLEGAFILFFNTLFIVYLNVGECLNVHSNSSKYESQTRINHHEAVEGNVKQFQNKVNVFYFIVE